MRIGIDFGGVLTATSTPPSENFLHVPPRESSYETITQLKETGDEPILISKAGSEEKEAKARLWLSHWNFDRLFSENIEFCRSQEGKRKICRRLEVDVMIDDTPRQLKLLEGIVQRRLLFNAEVAPLGMIAVKNWKEVTKTLPELKGESQ